MINPFMSGGVMDTDTAIIFEKAIIHDIGNAIAYTDGEEIYLNTEENLKKLLEVYDVDMLKWILRHEETHKLLDHKARYFNFVERARRRDTPLNISPEEVNIIMDILVHDLMISSEQFSEKTIEKAKKNAFQFRDSNILHYEFQKQTLEDMLAEYIKHKEDKSKNKEDKSEKNKESKSKDKEDKSENKKDKSKQGKKNKEEDTPKDKKENKENKEDTPKEKTKVNVNWKQLDERSQTEFITYSQSEMIKQQVKKIKFKKINIAILTQTLNGLATNTQKRSYKTPNYAQMGQNTIFKGHQNVNASLYLCFDASGSMDREIQLFKNIIQKSIPKALDTPTAWFSGYNANRKNVDKEMEDRGNYFKGKFRDILPVEAMSGYADDGDRTIELCHKAEMLGYTPIGVTDGGGRLSWSTNLLKELKRTILIGQRKEWLDEVKEVNPKIQTIYIGED